ncbi:MULTISPECIES: hypothetical protein [Halomonas]|uniref:hypothetical protein n=1 Tax=Halomonas TaxID=2745 RepID=UPI001C9758A2|nr:MULTISPECIES: hypothetical protein [Halomonas]MBY6207821.1 hypothetical protein [Halomonas sp. DP3Y7-2]MBY6228630.1 hypothetical protein [Halomonas sp. DP3Y7-1]MCA0916696.1 hypothetical protein [Halomonas denitrificans]
MNIKLHKPAITVPKARAEIQAGLAHITVTTLAERYGVGDMTVRRHRDDVYGCPQSCRNLKASLHSNQDEALIAAPAFLRLGLDDILVVVRELFRPTLSRAALQRMLKRRQMLALAQLA